MTSAAQPIRRSWQQVAADQDTVLTRWQARYRGMSEDAWQWKLDRRLWTPIFRGIVATHSGEVTPRQYRWAARLRIGQDGALIGDAALVELGFRLTALPVIDVGLADRPAGRALRMRPDGPIFRPRSVTGLADMVHPRPSLTVVRAPWAVLLAAALAPTDKAAEWRLAAVVQQGLTDVPALRRCLEQLPKLKRRALVLTVLDDVEFGAHAASELEFLRFCRRNGLPVPDQLQVKVRAGNRRLYVDACYTRRRVSVEVDGGHHRWVEQWDADVLRANDLAISAAGRGEVLLRFSAGNLRHEPERVAAQLRTALRG
jgi:very-short-patch-repair endonuclease